MVSLLSIATMKILRLPPAHLSRLRIPLGVRYPTRFLFLRGRRRKARPRSWILFSRSDPFRHLSRRQEALPASLETSSPLCPALGPRADLHALPKRRFGVAPARSNTKAPPFTLFRDSMTRLRGSLPTLEGSITGYQPRLASGGWSVLSGRVSSRQVSIEAFSRSLLQRFSFRLMVSVSNERHPRLSGLWLAPKTLELWERGVKLSRAKRISRTISASHQRHVRHFPGSA